MIHISTKLECIVLLIDFIDHKNIIPYIVLNHYHADSFLFIYRICKEARVTKTFSDPGYDICNF